MMKQQDVIVEPMDPIEQRIHDRVMADPVARRAYFQQRAMRRLGQAIRSAREGANLTQSELAESAGMTQAEISRIENALPVKGVTLATMVSLSDALNFRIAFEFEKLPAEASVRAVDDSKDELAAHLAVREMT
jgi:DNA-binding XRE family transcriptional regulator